MNYVVDLEDRDYCGTKKILIWLSTNHGKYGKMVALDTRLFRAFWKISIYRALV